MAASNHLVLTVYDKRWHRIDLATSSDGFSFSDVFKQFFLLSFIKMVWADQVTRFKSFLYRLLTLFCCCICAQVVTGSTTDLVEEYDIAADRWGAVRLRMPTPRDGGISAVGTAGGEMYEKFFTKFGFRIALEHGTSDIRRPSGETAAVVPLEEYSRTRMMCG